MSVLPLRLAAEHEACRILGASAAASLEDESSVVLVLGEGGVLALGPPGVAPAGWEGPLPAFACSQGDDGTIAWWRRASAGSDFSRLSRPPAALELVRGGVLNKSIAAVVVRATHRYYAAQVLEPSVRGFLGILEKQFPRSDLWIWELLQNAVDDGALNVVLEECRGTGGGLCFSHDGHAFTPLDVLGLCSVGLSTKAIAGKKSVGFMGIGFKAIYKRFADVTVSDNTWAFRFKEPKDSERPTMEPKHAWVLKPQAVTVARAAEDKWCRFDLMAPRGGDVAADLRPPPPAVPVLLGRSALHRLRLATGDNLAATAVGSAGPASRTDPSWRLDWGGQRFTISIDDLGDVGPRSLHGRSERVHVDVSDLSSGGVSVKRGAWAFFTCRFDPPADAKVKYEEHTKRAHAGSEEVALFFPVDVQTGVPKTRALSSFGRSGGSSAAAGAQPSASTLSVGLLHSTLPTTARLVGMPMHLNGSFLLSVDRQGVEVASNSWNQALLGQLPVLLRLLLTWVATSFMTELPAGALEATYALLPPLKRSIATNGCGALETSLLGETLSLREVDAGFVQAPLVPVCDDNPGVKGVAWCAASEAVWVPPALASLCGAAFLRAWLGKRPMATHLLGPAAASPLWRGLVAAPDERTLKALGGFRLDRVTDCATHASAASDMAGAALRLLAAVALATEAGAASHAKGGGGGGGGEVDGSCAGVEVRPLEQWPVFLTESGLLVMASQVRFFGEDVLSLPDDIRSDLESALSPQEDDAADDDEGGADNRGNNRNQRDGQWNNRHRHHQAPKQKKAAPKTAAVYVLHRGLEQRIRGVPTERGVGGASASPVDDPTAVLAAQRCLAAAAAVTSGHGSSESLSCAVGVAVAFPRAFSRLAVSQALSPAQVISALRLTAWALKSNQPHLVSHALVDLPPALISSPTFPSGANGAGGSADSSRRPRAMALVPVASAFVGRCFDDESGADLEDAASNELSFISPLYLTGVTASTGDPQPQPFQPSARLNAERHKWSDFWQRAGAQVSVSFVASLSEVRGRPGAAPDGAHGRSLHSFLPEGLLPDQRKTSLSGAACLPYGLGAMQSAKSYYSVDAALAPVWRSVLGSLQRSTGYSSSSHTTISREGRALSFARSLSRCKLEHNLIALDKTVAAAKDAFKPLLSTSSAPASSGGGVVMLASGKLVVAASDGNACPIGVDSAVPSRKRLFWLPPGQPGASALDCGPAAWVTELASARWVPVLNSCAAGAGSGSSEPTLFPPRQTLLAPDPSRPDMPVADLPASVRSALGQGPLGVALAWGTETPPPPVDALLELMAHAHALIAEAGGDTASKGEASPVALLTACRDRDAGPRLHAMALDMVPLLRLVAQSSREGKLQASDKQKLNSARISGKIFLPTAGLRCPEPLVPARRLFLALSSAADGSGRGPFGRLEVALVKAHYLIDGAEPRWALSTAANDLAALFASSSSSSSMGLAMSFLAWFPAALGVPSDGLPTVEQRSAFSAALWSSLGGGDQPRPLSAAALRRALPSLRVLCLGPSLLSSSSTDGGGLPAAWLPVWPSPAQDHAAGYPRPLVDDDRSCARRPFLRPIHRLQVTPLFFHAPRYSPEEDECERLMADALGILRLSDPDRFTLKTRVRGKPELLVEPSRRLRFVLELVDAIQGRGEAASSTTGQARPKLVRYLKLGKEFAAHRLPFEAPVVAEEQYAAWGRLWGGRHLTVAGDADDYHVELAELIVASLAPTRVSSDASSSLTALNSSTLGGAQSKDLGRALRLLRHLEEPDAFAKFLGRDFGTHPVAVRCLRAEARAQSRGEVISALGHALALAPPGLAQLLKADKDGGTVTRGLGALQASMRSDGGASESSPEAEARAEEWAGACAGVHDSALELCKEAALAAVGHNSCCLEDDDNDEDAVDAAFRSTDGDLFVRGKRDFAESVALARLVAEACGTVLARRAVKQSIAMAQLLAATASVPQAGGDCDDDACTALRAALAAASSADLAPTHPFVQGAFDALHAFGAQHVLRLPKRQRSSEAALPVRDATEPRPAWNAEANSAAHGPQQIPQRDRGVVNLPAWMTKSSEGSEASEGGGATSQESDSPATDAPIAEPSGAVRCAVTSDGARAAEPPMPSRSRGVVNLPAWMTKASEEHTEEASRHEPGTKRSRTDSDNEASPELIGGKVVLVLASLAVGHIASPEAHTSLAASFIKRQLLVPSAAEFIEQLTRNEALCKAPAIKELLDFLR